MPYKNIEDQRECVRKYRNEHREKIRAQTRIQAREWARNHPEAARKWNEENSEKRKEIARRSHLKKVGWTIEEFDAAFQKQNETCWICHTKLTREKGFGNTAHADHNHSTGKRRAILCTKCNLIEGLLDKCAVPPTEFLSRLLEYYKTFDLEKENAICSVAGD